MLTTFAVVRVIRSKDSKYSEGDILLNGYGLVAEYSIVPSSHIIRKIDPANGISLSDYLGSLGSFSTFIDKNYKYSCKFYSISLKGLTKV